MVNKSRLMRRLKRRLGSEIFNAFPMSTYDEILADETLLTFSTYYPKYVRDILMRANTAMGDRDGSGNVIYRHYKIPNHNNDEFIGVELARHPQNEIRPSGYGYASGNIIVHAMAQKITSSYPRTAIAFHFEAPDILILDPPPRYHRDFVITMTAVKKLHEIPTYYEEYFTRLFILDVKDFIYNEFKSIRDESNLNGSPVSLKIDEYSSAADDRLTLLEQFDEDYYRDPEKLETMMLEAE